MNSMKGSLTQAHNDDVQISVYIYALTAIHRVLIQCSEQCYAMECHRNKGQKKGKANGVGEVWRGTLKL